MAGKACKMKAHGGRTNTEAKVISEAHGRKRGGRLVADTDADGKATGGAVVAKEAGKVPGRKSGGRLDKLARGGRTGSDKSPFSSAKMD
jgi:hypothetical protein